MRITIMRYGFVIDQDRCIGCHACTVACKEEHNVPIGVFRTWVKYIEKGEFPDTSRHFGVLRCNHCDAAPCIEICPTTSLYRRKDGIVDFDSERCIGCKSCMQACPYDALYIDPNSNTAAKCNYCAHRVELDLQPACVIVCPTQAIITGDLDDSRSDVSRIIATQAVSTRKPYKNTEPKLFYVGIDADLLQPTAPAHQESHFWSDQQPGETVYALATTDEVKLDAGASRVVYDVAHPAPWEWKIAAYMWTKAIAAGVLIVAAMLLALGTKNERVLISIASPIVAMIFTGLTALILIFDLKRPDRFYYLLTKPNLRSWVVIGAYILIGYGGLSFGWLFTSMFAGTLSGFIVYPAAAFGIGSAGYSAFLFAQGNGRDLWQSRLFLWQLLSQAIVAGASVLIILAAVESRNLRTTITLDEILVMSLLVSLAIAMGELFFEHLSADAKLAADLMIRGELRPRFWLGAIGLGLVLPSAILAVGLYTGILTPPALLAAVCARAGIWIFESIWIEAGQPVALS
jgi:Fe-S-cluster-containing dehydrogenase component/formate-dependent nitrite reductase membrane component NrfD